MMPKISWPQRVASDAVARDEIASDVLVATVSSIPALWIESTLALAPFNYELAPIREPIFQSRSFNAVLARRFD
jgi:hypothetical protein